MKRFSLFTGALLFLSSLTYADTIDRPSDGQDIDVQALRDWINTKRQVTVKEIGGNLSISGEVRTEFLATGETKNGISQRGSGTPFPARGYDIVANLLMDYRADLTWASFKLDFRNRAGIDSGTTEKIKLGRAFFGARAVDGDSYYVDFELGRRKLNSAFDSMVQFSSYFDGVLVKYDQSFERMGDFYIHLATFIINSRIDQYGYIGETGFMNIADTGLYTKFSVIDWDTKNLHNSLLQDRINFLVSQWIVGYRFYPAKLQKQVTIYLAGLYNAKAKRLAITDNKKANWGTYVGFNIGQLKKKGDWSLSTIYQVLAAQCVPDYDMGGIGLGNINNTGFYFNPGPGGTLVPTTRETAAGNGNFHGIAVTLNYLLTNNLNMQQQWSHARTLDYDIGPSRKFKQYEIDFIYGF